MICQQYSTQNEADARFCAECGRSRQEDNGAQNLQSVAQSQGGTIGVWVVDGLCLLYLLNPTLGVFELIPDNLPIIGNLDELTASAGLLWALRNLGVRLPGF